MHEQASKDSRRAFMKAIAGGLAVSLPILKGGQASGMGVYEDCLAECYADYVLCCYAASRQPWHIRTPARGLCRRLERLLCRLHRWGGSEGHRGFSSMAFRAS
jgi:hypothetical protein